MIKTLKRRIKKTFTKFLNIYNKSINLILRVIKTIKEFLTIFLRLIKTDFFLLVNVSDLTITETLNTNWYGRIIVLLRCFKE